MGTPAIVIDPATGERVQLKATQIDPQTGERVAPAATPAPSADGSWWDHVTAPYTEIQPHQIPHNMQELGHEAVKGVGNIGAGGLGVLLHPLDTLGSVGSFALRANPVGE